MNIYKLQNNIKKKLAWMNKLKNILKVNWKEKRKEKVGAEWKWEVMGHAKLNLEVKILEVGVF